MRGNNVMSKRMKIYNKNVISACYFRSTAEPPYKKVILQITERCNLMCKHCFVSSSSQGNMISYDQIKEIILPKLLECNTIKVTLTGGEPLVHPNIKDIIKLLSTNGISVAICTNAVLVNDDLITVCAELGNVHFNVSLDGFRAESHGKFRGNENPNIFRQIIDNISKLGAAKLLNGILVTPNKYAEIIEYEQICIFAKEIGAKYVLFNPLSEFGRGQDTVSIGYYREQLIAIKKITNKYCCDQFEVVYIRFPDESKSIGKCPLGKILYIFTNGDIAICPYIVFAAFDRISIYKPEQFIITNIFSSQCDIDAALNSFQLPVENAEHHNNCNSQCSKGCYAAKISHGLSIYDCDFELCGKKGDT